jgi:hypothetical protein
MSTFVRVHDALKDDKINSSLCVFRQQQQSFRIPRTREFFPHRCRRQMSAKFRCDHMTAMMTQR